MGFEVDENDMSSNVEQNILVRAYVMFLLTWQTLFRVSDTGINILLQFFSVLLKLLASGLRVTALNSFCQCLPLSIKAAKKYIGTSGDLFTKYASCPLCDSIYPVDTCKVMQPDKTFASKKCTNVKFPNHPHATQRRPCNTQLLKRVRTPAGTTSLYPRRMFCYQSLVDALGHFMQRPGFVQRCELWRTIKNTPNTLSDIYDGKVWSEFLNVNGIPFFICTI